MPAWRCRWPIVGMCYKAAKLSCTIRPQPSCAAMWCASRTWGKSSEGRMDPVAEIIAAREKPANGRIRMWMCVFWPLSLPQGGQKCVPFRYVTLMTKGFGLLLNTTSPKWQQLSASGQCCLHMLWSTVRRQYRVYGRLEPMEPERLRAIGRAKAIGSRLLEHYYDTFHAQSQPIPSRAYLLQGIDELRSATLTKTPSPCRHAARCLFVPHGDRCLAWLS